MRWGFPRRVLVPQSTRPWHRGRGLRQLMFTSRHAAARFRIERGGVGSNEEASSRTKSAATSLTTTGYLTMATSAAKIVYTDNYSNAGFNGITDIHAIDLAGTAAASTIMTGADANVVLTPDKSTIVYSWHGCTGAVAGIYTVAAP